MDRDIEMRARVEVIQADRDAAGAFVRQAWHLFWPNDYSRAMHDADEIVRGDNDNWHIVQAFARHRLAALSASPLPGREENELRSIYDVLHCIYDTCSDEGDRIYLGSTNDHHTLKRQLRRLEKLLPPTEG